MFVRYNQLVRGHPAPAETRFWEKVNKTETCWLWTAGTAGAGYASFWNGTRRTYAYRFAYELLVGPIPEGLTLDHLCRRRDCVNPAHCEPVSIRENTRRGQNPRNVAHLTDTCKRGHDLNDSWVSPAGSRACRACHRDRQAARMARKRKAAA